MDHVCLRISQAGEFPVVLEGKFEVDGPKGRVDAYSVRIEFSKDFPLSPPLVFETDGRLPHHIDWHVIGNGYACLEVWPVWRAQNTDPTVRSVLNGPVRNFFLSQSFFEANGHWPFGEYSHGDPGRREALKTLFRAASAQDKDLLWRVNALVNPPRRQNSCPCGSSRLYCKCHQPELQEIASNLDQSTLWLVTDMYLKILERAKNVAQ